jgi:hypothetical protein
LLLEEEEEKEKPTTAAFSSSIENDCPSPTYSASTKERPRNKPERRESTFTPDWRGGREGRLVSHLSLTQAKAATSIRSTTTPTSTTNFWWFFQSPKFAGRDEIWHHDIINEQFVDNDTETRQLRVDTEREHNKKEPDQIWEEHELLKEPPNQAARH